jgi:hypothetical protein
MKYFCSSILFLFLFLISCNDNTEKRDAENLKDANKKEIIFKNIDKGWNFSIPALNPTSRTIVSNWKEWASFLDELSHKPKSSIGAFQKKAKALSKKVVDLNTNIPAEFNKPEIKSRISVLRTKVNAINLFINLDDIPDQKVVSLVSEINVELVSLTNQMNEIVRKNAIPKEEGESDMIQMLDATRAVPTVPSDITSPKN